MCGFPSLRCVCRFRHPGIRCNLNRGKRLILHFFRCGLSALSVALFHVESVFHTLRIASSLENTPWGGLRPVVLFLMALIFAV